jgi:hypothetical protein
MAAGPQAVPDLHFNAEPVQCDGPAGSVIMVRVAIADNFGMTFQLMLPAKAASAFGRYLRDAAANAETMLVKPKSPIITN